MIDIKQAFLRLIRDSISELRQAIALMESGAMRPWEYRDGRLVYTTDEAIARDKVWLAELEHVAAGG